MDRTVDLHVAFERSEGWTEPVALEELNTPGPDYGPAISADGKYLYYRASSQFRRVPLEPVLRRHRPP